MEKKRGKILQFSPKKVKRKFGDFFQSILRPSKTKKAENKFEEEILAKPLLIESSESFAPVKRALQRKGSLVGNSPTSQIPSESIIPGTEVPLRSLQKPLPPSTSNSSTATATPMNFSIMKTVQERTHTECNSPTSSTTATAIVTPVKIHRVHSEQNQANQECLSPSNSDTVTALVTPIKLPSKVFHREAFSSCASDVTNDAKVTPLKICRRRRTAPKISDSQSSHDYSLKTKTVDIPSESRLGEDSAPQLDPLVDDIFGDELRNSKLSSEENNTPDETPKDLTQWLSSPLSYGDEFNESDSADENIIEENLDINFPSPICEQNLSDTIVPCEHLPNPVLENNTKRQMQDWLRSKKERLGGNKQVLIERIKKRMALDVEDPVAVPTARNVTFDDVIQDNLIPLTQEISLCTDQEIFHAVGWGIFPSRDIPTNFNFGSVFYYLIETMPQLEPIDPNITECDDDANPSSSDKEDSFQITIPDPFEDAECKEIRCSKKLRRGLQYVKSGYLRNVHDVLTDRVHLYKGQVRASMNAKAYLVKVAVSQLSGSILKCVCDEKCPVRALGRCSHISALLLHVLLHKNLNGPEAITCTSKPVTWNTGSLKRRPSMARERQYDTFKIDVKRRGTFDPRATKFQTGYPTQQQKNEFLSALQYKKKPSQFQNLMNFKYEEFEFDADDKKVLKMQREQLYLSLIQQLNDLKPYPLYSGAFEVAGTVEQSETELWQTIRALHCSAQPSRQIAHFKKEDAKMNFLRKHLWRMKTFEGDPPPIAYGKKHEDEARNAYAELQQQMDPSAVVEKCGLHLHTDFVGFSCSPDGIKTSSMHTFPKKLLEIKAIFSLKDCDITQFESILPKEKLVDFCVKRDSEGKIVLKDNHKYYDQVQFSMGLLNLPECDLFLWTEKSSLTVPVPFDNERWLSLSKKLFSFHWQYLEPEYFAKRTPRNLVPVCLY